jgi:thymidylate kinase
MGKNEFVICDKYFYSTVATFSTVLGEDLKPFTLYLSKCLLIPDRVFLIETDYQVLLERRQDRIRYSSHDKKVISDKKYFDALRKCLRTVTESPGTVIVDNTKPLDTTAKELLHSTLSLRS